MDGLQSPQKLLTTPLLPRRSQPTQQRRRPDPPFPIFTRGKLLCIVLLGIFAVAQFGVSMPLPFNVADNRIMTTIAFVLSLGLVSLWGTFMYLKDYRITYGEWATFAGLVIVGVLKFLAMLYQFKLGYDGDNPFINDYSFVPAILGSAAFWAESQNDRRNQRRHG